MRQLEAMDLEKTSVLFLSTYSHLFGRKEQKLSILFFSALTLHYLCSNLNIYVMLKTVLSISGKPGLFKLINQGKNMLIVESLLTHKRVPAYARDKVVSLGDIAIYTTEEEVPLANVFKTIYDKEGKVLDASLYKTEEQLRAFFVEILPNYDEDRVYATDIKRVISWYNILVNAGITDFVPEEKEEQQSETNEK